MLVPSLRSIKRTVVADPCEPTWNETPNTHVLGGKVNSASTVEACKAACVRNTSCTGVDWNPRSSDGRKCWLSGPWSGERREGMAPGITRYDIVRPSELLNCSGRLCTIYKCSYRASIFRK